LENLGEPAEVRLQDMIGADVGGEIEPEAGELGKDLSLVGDEGGKDKIKGRYPVRGDDQELVAQIIDVPDFSFFKKRELGDVDFRNRLVHGR
jgi:hypothetical protein